MNKSLAYLIFTFCIAACIICLISSLFGGVDCESLVPVTCDVTITHFNLQTDICRISQYGSHFILFCPANVDILYWFLRPTFRIQIQKKHWPLTYSSTYSIKPIRNRRRRFKARPRISAINIVMIGERQSGSSNRPWWWEQPLEADPEREEDASSIVSEDASAAGSLLSVEDSV